MPTVGVTVRLWSPIRKQFDRQIAHIGLRRDAFLARVVRLELPRLDEAIAQPVPKESATFIRHQLKRLDTDLVTLRLPDDLLASLDAMCDTKKIVRDSFFNRLIFALCVKPETFLAHTHVGPVTGIAEWLHEGWQTQGEQFEKGPLDAAAAVLDDPLWVIRACLAEAAKKYGEGPYEFYDIELRYDKVDGFRGLNVYYDTPPSKDNADIFALLGIDRPGDKGATAK